MLDFRISRPQNGEEFADLFFQARSYMSGKHPPKSRVHRTVHRWAQWVGRTWARFSYARHIEPTWLELNHLAVGVPDLPALFEGMKVGHLSDFHGGKHLPEAYLQHAVETTMAQSPDVIALTGDFIHKGYHHIAETVKVLSRLQAPLGVYAVLGNHDFAVRNALGFRRYRGLHRAVTDSLEAAGIRVLRNQTVPLERENQRVFLAGLDDLWSRECDPHLALGGLCPKTPRVVMAHNPLTVDLLGEHRCDLMLSGHTHGGQVDWPGLGRLFLGRKARRLAAGLYHHDEKTHVYVNKGVGFGLRFRFRVRPEVAIVKLHSRNHHALRNPKKH